MSILREICREYRSVEIQRTWPVINKGRQMKYVASRYKTASVGIQVVCVVLLQASGLANTSTHALVLEADGRTVQCIVVPDEASSVADFAAEELSRCVSASVGLTLPIVRASSPRISKPAFVLGSSKITEELGIDPTQLKREGCYLITTNGFIIIVGDDHPAYTSEIMRKGDYPRNITVVHREAGTRVGTVFGVYTFIKDVIGADWYFPGPLGEVIPKHERIEIPSMNRIIGPSFEQRRIWIGTNHTGIDELPMPEVTDARFQYEHVWAFRSRQGMSRACRGAHTMDSWGKLFGESHPEYFALLDGRRLNDWGWNGTNVHGTGRDFCWASPATIKQQIEEMRLYFNEYRDFQGGKDRHPWIWVYSDPQYFPIGANDGEMSSCECEYCSIWAREDGSASDMFGYHVAQVAKAAKEEFPDKYIEFMAYGSRLLPPKNIEFPDNVRVVFAGLDPLNLVRSDDTAKLIDDWSAKCEISKMWLYTDAIRRQDWYIPLVMPHVVGNVIKACVGKAEGFFFCQGESATGAYTQPELYVATELMWDVGQDIDTLLDRMYQGLYGVAAEDVKACYTHLENTWIEGIEKSKDKKIYGWEQRWTNIFTVERLLEALEHIRKARSRLETWDPEARTHVGKYSKEWIRVTRFEKTLLSSIGQCIQASPSAAKMFDEQTPKAEAIPVNYIAIAPTIDGELSDNAWNRPPDGHMVGIVDGIQARPETYIWIGLDGSNLYAAIKCMEPTMDKVAAFKSSSAKTIMETIFGKNDDVEIFLDVANNCRTYYQLAIDAAGQSWSAGPKGSNISEIECDYEVGKTGDCWTVEAAIPFSELGGVPSRGTRWGINIVRTQRGKEEAARTDHFGWFPSGDYHEPRRYGRIVF